MTEETLSELIWVKRAAVTRSGLRLGYKEVTPQHVSPFLSFLPPPPDSTPLVVAQPQVRSQYSTTLRRR